jgi:hypothetical protein
MLNFRNFLDTAYETMAANDLELKILCWDAKWRMFLKATRFVNVYLCCICQSMLNEFLKKNPDLQSMI